MKHLKNISGFTLIEIISVILVVGIIGAVAVPMFSTSHLDVSVSGDTVQGDIQYAQELAMTRDQDVSITFNQNASSYDTPSDPNGVYSAETRNFPQNVTIYSSDTTITFNSFGEKVGPTQTIILWTGAPLPDPPPPGPGPQGSITITVEQFTGRVSVS